LILNEFLDFSLTAKIVAKSANRALGLVMEKCETIGGVSYDVLKKLIDSLVTPIIEYGGYNTMYTIHLTAFVLCCIYLPTYDWIKSFLKITIEDRAIYGNLENKINTLYWSVEDSIPKTNDMWTNVTQWRKRGDLCQLPMRKSNKRDLK
jgi:hypothetical protein